MEARKAREASKGSHLDSRPPLHMALPPATLAEQLIGFANSPPAWDQVQTTALELANALRSKGAGISTYYTFSFLEYSPSHTRSLSR